MQTEQKKQITIMVSQPEASTNTSNSFVTYLVQGIDKHGKFTIRRRYNDFYLLRQIITQNWMGLYIPPIASKKVTGNKEEKFVEERKRFLHYFCVKIAERPYLFYSQQFQAFIRGDNNIEKAFKQLPLISFTQKLKVYKQSFEKHCQNSNSAQLLLKTQTDYSYLKQAQKSFDSIRDQFKSVSQAKKSYAQHFIQVFGTIIPEYQDKFLLQHVGKDKDKLIINTDKTKEKIKEYNQLIKNNPLEDYVEMISYELRQARSLIQAVETRRKAQALKVRMDKIRRQLKDQIQKLSNGKSTIKSFFSTGSKQQRIEVAQKQMANLELEIQSLNEMIKMMNAVTNYEINNYKTKRGNEYVNVLKQVARKQIKELSAYGRILKGPIQNFEQK